MNFRVITFLFCLLLAGSVASSQRNKIHKVGKKYIVVNDVAPTDKGYGEIYERFYLDKKDKKIGIGIGFILHCLGNSTDENLKKLNSHFLMAEKYDIPIVVQLDVEQWWDARPDLWNWWDENKPGYNPENTKNVEWTGWTKDSAVKIGWRNWGRQLRVLPMPNLMSKDYRRAAHQELNKIAPVVLNWWRNLPANKKHLLFAIKIGWESAIGVSNWYYPGGNLLLDKPEKDDPQYGLTLDSIPGRNVQTIGYNAARTMGLAKDGPMKDKYITAIVRAHLTDLSKLMFDIGFPREKIFTHCGGWSKNETLHKAAINKYSCPGWSFYDHAPDPSKDKSVMDALRQNTAPYWGAVEWLYMGKSSLPAWKSAIEKTMSIKTIKYMCIFNWDLIKGDSNSVAAINEIIAP